MSDIDAMIHTAVGSPALLAAILLGTPTLIWIFWRLMFGRPPRQPDSTVGYLWVCQLCHSANPPNEAACYGCGNRMDRFDSIKLIDAVTGAVIQSMPDGTPMIVSLPTVPIAPPASAGRAPAAAPAIPVGPGSTAPSDPVIGTATTHVPPTRSMAAVGARRPHEVGSTNAE